MMIIIITIIIKSNRVTNRVTNRQVLILQSRSNIGLIVQPKTKWKSVALKFTRGNQLFFICIYFCFDRISLPSSINREEKLIREILKN